MNQNNSQAKETKGPEEPHILILPYPIPGHLNPLLQFAKRLASKNLTNLSLSPTFFLSKSLHFSSSSTSSSSSLLQNLSFHPISDGCDDAGLKQASSVKDYVQLFRTHGSKTLADVFIEQQLSDNRISFLIYDSFLPWALDVAKRFDVPAAAFFTQSAVVDAIYYDVFKGEIGLPVEGESVSSAGGLLKLKLVELPSPVKKPEALPGALDLFVDQFSNLEGAHCVLLNTFDALEVEVVRWMSSIYPCKTIGPTVPSAYLDKSIEGDTEYGMILHDQDPECMKWLDSRDPSSVVYTSFGSIAMLSPEQMEEIAWGLIGSNTYFLWVVRESEEPKLPNTFKEEARAKGLIVRWAPQLEVLAHPSVRCFVTHCGWNSTLEALSLGVPMVGIPIWTDQPTNAKCMEEMWGVGVRGKADDKDIVRREEVEACIREVMGEERGSGELRRNASKWKRLAKEAMSTGGSSYMNIEEFVSSLSCL